MLDRQVANFLREFFVRLAASSSSFSLSGPCSTPPVDPFSTSLQPQVRLQLYLSLFLYLYLYLCLYLYLYWEYVFVSVFHSCQYPTFQEKTFFDLFVSSNSSPALWFVRFLICQFFTCNIFVWYLQIVFGCFTSVTYILRQAFLTRYLVRIFAYTYRVVCLTVYDDWARYLERKKSTMYFG